MTTFSVTAGACFVGDPCYDASSLPYGYCHILTLQPGPWIVAETNPIQCWHADHNRTGNAYPVCLLGVDAGMLCVINQADWPEQDNAERELWWETVMALADQAGHQPFLVPGGIVLPVRDDGDYRLHASATADGDIYAFTIDMVDAEDKTEDWG